MNEIATALRNVTAKMQEAVKTGRRSPAIDAHDLIEVLLAPADELDPEFPNLVGPAQACPQCGERDADRLVWETDETVRCAGCGAAYRPGP